MNKRTLTAALLLWGALTPALRAESLGDRRLVQSPDGGVLASLLKSGAVEFLAADGTVLSAQSLGSGPVELAFSPDGQKAAIALWGGGIVLADVRGGTGKTFEDGRACSSLTWSPDGRRLLYVRKGPAQEELMALEAASGSVKSLRSYSLPGGGSRADEHGPIQLAPSSPPPPPADNFPPPPPRPDARGRIPTGRGPR